MRVVLRTVGKTFSKEATHGPLQRVLKTSQINGSSIINRSLSEASTAMEEDVDPTVIVRSNGPCRSVMVYRPTTMRPYDWKDIAERWRLLGRNRSVVATLVSFFREEGSRSEAILTALPLEAHEHTREFQNESMVDPAVDILGVLEDVRSTGDDRPPLRLVGFDPTSMDPSDWRETLEGMGKLAVAATDSNRRTPSIVVPPSDGLSVDGSLAFWMGQYVLVSPGTYYRIQNPERGLALDPCGLSYVLERLGLDHGNHRTIECGRAVAALMALVGHTADAYDLLATGLATHLMSTSSSTSSSNFSQKVQAESFLPTLEAALADLPPLEYQGIIPRKPRSQAQFVQDYNTYLETGRHYLDEDLPNRRFYNAAVHNVIESLSSGQADGDDFLAGPRPYFKNEPSKDSNSYGVYDETDLPMGVPLESYLIDVADGLRPVLERDTVEGIREGLVELAAVSESKTADPSSPEHYLHPDYDEFYDTQEVAKKLLRALDQRSPLALCAVHRLLAMARSDETTLEECIQRERTVQWNLLHKEDFATWQKHGTKNDPSEAPPLPWKHRSVSEVTEDEVVELFQDSNFTAA